MSTVSTERPDDADAPAGAPVIELRGITKRFPGVVANSDVNLTVGRGEVHAVVGENGAGKSTLMKTLYGMHQPDEGTILLEGRPGGVQDPDRGHRRRHRHGPPALHAGRQLHRPGEHHPGQRAGARRPASTSRPPAPRCSRSPTATASGCAPTGWSRTSRVADQQRVEIAKVLYRGARVLILDEPTAVLVPQEVDELFANLAGLRAEGLSVIFISHKLDEVLKVADRITVIRRGTTVGTADPKAVTARQLAEMMVGSELPVPETRESTVTDHVQLGVRGVSAVGSEGTTVLDDISFELHRGEVVGFAGVEGNGQSELVEMLLGLVHPTAGSVTLDGEDITAWSTERRREHGIAFVPEDRHRQAPAAERTPLGEPRAGAPVVARACSAGRSCGAGSPGTTPRASCASTTSVPRGRTRWPARCPAATSRSSSSAASWRPARACSSPRTPPAASTSARRPPSGTASATPAPRAWPRC